MACVFFVKQEVRLWQGMGVVRGSEKHEGVGEFMYSMGHRRSLALVTIH